MNFLCLTGAEKRALAAMAVLVAVGGVVHVIKRHDPESLPGYRLVAREPAPEIVAAPTAPAVLLGGGINPSTAHAEDLELLPGIGPAMAQRIVEYRELHGDFKKPSDLLSVPGIGERTLARITPYLCFP